MPDTEQSRPDEKCWTILEVLNWTHSYFQSHDIDSPRLTAEILLAHNLGMKRIDLYLQYDRPLEKQELSRYKLLIRRRTQNEPVAYITGSKGFFESELDVTADVLIPRPETELLVELTLDCLKEIENSKGKATVLDLGTGSGAIIVSVSKAAPRHHFFATDVSENAISMARQNAMKVSSPPISFSIGSWFDAVPSSLVCDVIVSNPPYIPSADMAQLQNEVKDFEPRLALDGGPDGLDCYRDIIGKAHQFLAPGGVLLFEIGFDQQAGIRKILEEFNQYQPPVFKKDLSGLDRVVTIKKSID